MDEPITNERRVRLGALNWRPKKPLRYDYDFGDNWRHESRLGKVLPIAAGVRYPKCIGGARACPPEDISGLHGYGDFLEAIGYPTNEGHESMLGWVGGAFDPEFFSLDGVNAELWKTSRK